MFDWIKDVKEKRQCRIGCMAYQWARSPYYSDLQCKVFSDGSVAFWDDYMCSYAIYPPGKEASRIANGYYPSSFFISKDARWTSRIH